MSEFPRNFPVSPPFTVRRVEASETFGGFKPYAVAECTPDRVLKLLDAEGKTAVEINLIGEAPTVRVRPDYEMTEAARLFWNTVRLMNDSFRRP